MDRCALFVDAGYVLADGAMAVHGTRRRESVSWNYEGLLQLLGSLATERSGLPLLRCYWYEATVEGRRSADHDALADLPGVKLRLAKMRPGRREGVESEIHRDLETLARNKAISEAMVVSAEEDLAQVVADVQDLGLRVTLLHIASDADWTISRALRQECDDIVEISADLLRPYVELIAGAEPARADEHDGAPLIALRQAANGHGQPGRTAAYTPMPMGPEAGGSTVPAGAPGYDVPAESGAPAAPAALHELPPPQAPQYEPVSASGEMPAIAPDFGVPADNPHGADMTWRPDFPQRPDPVPQELYAAPVLAPVPADDQLLEFPAARARQAADLSGYNPGAVRDQPHEPMPADLADGMHAVPVAPPSAQIRRLPTRGQAMPAQPHGQPTGAHPVAGQPAGGPPTAGQPMLSAPTMAPPAMPAFTPARNGSYSGPQPVVPAGPPGPAGLASPPNPAGAPGPAAFAGAPQGTGMHAVPGPAGQPGANGPFYAPGPGPMDAGPAATGGAPGLVGVAGYPSAPPSVSLAEAVQSAHDEGQEFGTSVARDAPALWLEAVLARKPRMPSDLEARLLQGSTLPIDFLLHDEVRHALRRGFWDALERSRR